MGMGQDWKGGDVVRYPGGGHKVNLLKPVVQQWKDEKNTIVMFVDRYNKVTCCHCHSWTELCIDFYLSIFLLDTLLFDFLLVPPTSLFSTTP